MEPTISILKRVQDKLQRLARDRQQLVQENERLRTSLNEAREKLEKQQQELDTWKQKAEIALYTSGSMDESEKKQFEKRINAYLKEIDRCIALLSE